MNVDKKRTPESSCVKPAFLWQTKDESSFPWGGKSQVEAETYLNFSRLSIFAVRMLQVGIWRHPRFSPSVHSKEMIPVASFSVRSSYQMNHIQKPLGCCAYWGNWISLCKSCAAIISLAFYGSASGGGSLLLWKTNKRCVCTWKTRQIELKPSS